MPTALPVVAVRSWATEDMITQGVDGILTEDDEAAFAAAVVGLLKDEGRRRQLMQQARRAAQRFSIETCVERLERTYERLLGGCRGSPESRRWRARWGHLRPS